MADAPPTEAIVSGQPNAAFELAVVVKRTFDLLPGGRLGLADEQLPLVADPPPYEPKEPPLCPAPAWDCDLAAWKALTDVVVQGHAYGYKPQPVVEAELVVRDVRRVVRVHGPRRLERRGGGASVMPAEPFTRMPLRYDRAYGGYDAAAHARDGDPLIDGLAPQGLPGLATATRFHYPRNPAGIGFQVGGSSAPDGGEVPNLEFPFDPVTAERLMVDAPEQWMQAPLPAGFDWYSPGWFPRSGYLCGTPAFAAGGGPPPEVARGWAPPDIATREMKLPLLWDPMVLQGASPGLALHGIGPGTTFRLRNMFPEDPERTVTLPPLTPQVEITVPGRERLDAVTRVCSVVIRPDDGKLILVWSARAVAIRRYHRSELPSLRWRTTWS